MDNGLTPCAEAPGCQGPSLEAGLVVAYAGGEGISPVLAERDVRSVGIYFGVLTLITGLGDPGALASLPILFTLKDRLGYGPQAIAVFEAIVFLPVCLGFLFGFLRDRWRGRGVSDRTYLATAAPLAALSYFWLATGTPGYAKLLAATLVASIAYQWLDTAYDSLMTVVAQRHLMSGRLSALTEAVEVAPTAAAMLAGGWIVSTASARVAFLAAALVTGTVVVLAAWRPRAVFDQETSAQEEPQRAREAVLALLRHRPLLPAVLVLALWNFSPGFVTPLFYYLTDEVGASATGVGAYRALHLAAVAVASLAYGIACKRVPLQRLLRWGVALNIFPGALFLVMSSPGVAVALAPLLGLVSGFANVAFFDLLRRSCPERYEGMGTALGFSMFAAAGIGGDLLGAYVYERGGFLICLVIDAALTALILPVLRKVPRDLAHSRDGVPALRSPTAQPASPGAR